MGVLPFLIGLASIFTNFEKDFSVTAVCTYGATIISFISGIHWAIGMRNGRQFFWLLIASNVFTLLAWASLLIRHTKITLTIETACFVFLLVIDAILLSRGKMDLWFVKLRRRATLLVIAALLATLTVVS